MGLSSPTVFATQAQMIAETPSRLAVAADTIKHSPCAADAWVNFNGTGTLSIRKSYNVSSVTDNGVGDYTINFTTAMADANYCVLGSARAQTGQNNVAPNDITTPRTASACRILVVNSSNAVIDNPDVNVLFFGGN